MACIPSNSTAEFNAESNAESNTESNAETTFEPHVLSKCVSVIHVQEVQVQEFKVQDVKQVRDDIKIEDSGFQHHHLICRCY